MSVCPGCGRCRECGHAAPIRTYPWYGPYPTVPQPQPIWISLINTGAGNHQPAYPYTINPYTITNTGITNTGSAA